ncbi:hypothetical protein M409DRAFT_52861 [Zasmidium cellare ATCC 36951]|uniref:Uncharacterized protein n=1 Tax=Zasmidium cellare ATCC 36951 TaxID=1080233 RepID=A0A6A6CP73_ZASCE|nr:uncharacterized protein M409DRAFT_52861 [Zasmidium cellare ATCC 36951]KAF2168861.1 hypothetical protein M409DRAFT_52861 [Zasmidium cellare ATCC 36951]
MRRGTHRSAELTRSMVADGSGSTRPGGKQGGWMMREAEKYRGGRTDSKRLITGFVLLGWVWRRNMQIHACSRETEGEESSSQRIIIIVVESNTMPRVLREAIRGSIVSGRDDQREMR